VAGQKCRHATAETMILRQALNGRAQMDFSAEAHF
jgi:hypothetical protein